MASIYRKDKSPFWFIQFIDVDGKRRNKSTGLRADNTGDTVKARTLRAQMEAKELNRNAGEVSGGGWETWVPQWQHHGAKLLGGCCRTTPDTIRRIRNSLQKEQKGT